MIHDLYTITNSMIQIHIGGLKKIFSSFACGSKTMDPAVTTVSIFKSGRNCQPSQQGPQQTHWCFGAFLMADSIE
jgi:hypothetical protein